MPTPMPFTVDPVLTSIAINFKNPAVSLIADRVLPRIPVAAESFKWTYYPPDGVFTVPDTLVGRKGRVKEVEFTGEERTSSTQDHGLDTPIPQKDIDAARDMRAQGRLAYDPEARAVEGLTHMIELGREKRTADLVFAAGSYETGKKVVLSGTSKFTDQANSNPIGVINAGLDATFIMRPNTMVVGRAAWTALRSHPDIVSAVNRTSGDKGNATREAVAELFELSEIIVGESFLNTAKPGQAASYARVWGPHISLLYVDSVAAASDMPSFGWTAQYDGRVSGRMAEPKMGLKGGVTVRVGEQVRELISAPSVGYFIQDAA